MFKHIYNSSGMQKQLITDRDLVTLPAFIAAVLLPFIVTVLYCK